MLQALLPLLMGSMGGGASAGMLAGAGGAGSSGMMGGAMPWLSSGSAPMGASDMGSAMPWLDMGPTKGGADGYGSADMGGGMLQSLLNGLQSGGNTMNNPMQQQAVSNQNSGDKFEMVKFSPYSQVASGNGRTSLTSLLNSLRG